MTLTRLCEPGRHPLAVPAAKPCLADPPRSRPKTGAATGLCSDSEVVFSQGSTHGSIEMTAAELHRVALGLIVSGAGCVQIRVAPARQNFEPESREDPPTASITRILTQSQTTADSARGRCSNRLGNPKISGFNGLAFRSCRLVSRNGSRSAPRPAQIIFAVGNIGSPSTTVRPRTWLDVLLAHHAQQTAGEYFR